MFMLSRDINGTNVPVKAYSQHFVGIGCSLRVWQVDHFAAFQHKFRKIQMIAHYNIAGIQFIPELVGRCGAGRGNKYVH